MAGSKELFAYFSMQSFNVTPEVLIGVARFLLRKGCNHLHFEQPPMNVAFP